jgi:hypothetical protein
MLPDWHQWYASESDIANGISALLITFEMLVFALVHRQVSPCQGR